MADGNMIFTAAQLAGWTGCRLVGSGGVSVFSADVDSRRCRDGSIFFALPGENVDGHSFVDDAFGNGACGAVVESEWYDGMGSPQPGEGSFYLVCSDPLEALQKAAAGYMKGIDRPVRIGITGSNGKTTTKELVASVLSEKYSIVKTAGNFNSEIGLPLTVFNITNSHDYAVIEMGINRMGEMDVLTEILRPDMVVITNIGTAHIGIFKNMETIASEKRRAVSSFNEESILFIHEDEAYASFLSKGLKGRLVAYGRNAVDRLKGGLKADDRGLGGWDISFGSVSFRFPLVGRYNLENAFCAAVVGATLGLDDSEIAAGLMKSSPLFGRSEIIEGPVTIIQDCYNANGDSLVGSIGFADSLEWGASKIYVIGDMKELGSESAEIHRRAGLAAAESSADKVLFFGEDTRIAYNAALEAEYGLGTDRPVLYHTNDYAELESELLESLEPGDLVLLKGSRTMNLERLVGPVRKNFRSAEC